MIRPDIVLVVADQLAPQFLGAHGCAQAITPHIDALAARGARFEAAYCNSPLCAPSRAAFMTGQRISRLGTWDNAAEFPASAPTFAHALNALGYRTCLAGRMHFVGPDQLHGFSERLTTDIYPADFAWTPDWRRNDERIDWWYHNLRTVRQAGPALATFQTDYDDEVGFAARRWLIDRARDRAAGEDRPFLLVASFMHPHDPYVAKQEYWDHFADPDIPLPALGPDDVPAAPYSRRLAAGIEADTVHLTDDQIRAARRGYFANTTYFDAHLGAIVETLRATGLDENTVILVTSDHGDMLGERGLWFKMSFFEHSARVPLILAGPGIAEGAVIDGPCSLVDIAPTLIELAGGRPDMLGVELDGRSLLPAASGTGDAPGEAVAEYCAEIAGAPMFMIRRGRFKYIHCDLDPPQLYDLAADPGETRNLAADPAHAELAASFAQEVARRWDSAALRAQVIESQRGRLNLHEAMLKGGFKGWDYTPPRDGTQEYVRNHMDWEVAARRLRFPPV